MLFITALFTVAKYKIKLSAHKAMNGIETMVHMCNPCKVATLNVYTPHASTSNPDSFTISFLLSGK